MKHKKLKIALISATVAVLMLVASMTVYAYFTTRVYVYTDNGDKQVAQVGMNLQLLFGKLELPDTPNLGIPSYNAVYATTGADVEDGSGVWSPVAGDGQYLSFNDGSADNPTIYNPNAPWGSAQNPYVISESRHLQNLSALQSVGYFDLLYIANNFDADGNYIEGSASIPYFVICNRDGTPVTISGKELAAIEPIGSAEHPFVGVIGGAFVEGETTVAGKTTADDKNSSVSTIHGFNVQTNTNQTDVGLFGYVGFLGKEPTAAELETLMEDSTYVPHFTGVFSSIRELLISDVQVTVNNPTVIEVISELFEPMWKAFFGESNILHRFTFSDKSNAAELFHETHHIGIFAGHVSYAMIDEINVYYSDEETYALDVTGADLDKDNYYSASGILGMMYNMNCTIENSDDGHCRVLLGTGTSGDEVGNGGEGTGTGGGALSGNGRGYVTAAEIFSDFNNVAVKEDTNNELLWKYRTSADGDWVENAILILKKNDGNDGTYTLLDGTTSATVNANGVTVGDNTWPNFFIREIYQDTAGNDMLRYVTSDGTAVRECELMGNKDKGQTIWKFSAGGDGIWHYGIRVIESGDTYKLEDGTVVTFDKANNVITDGTNVWQSFFIEEDVNGTLIPFMYDPVLQKNWTVSVYERKPMTLIESYRVNEETGAIEELCVEWMRERLFGGTEATGLYYFYDGVFTFGLSSPEDTIRDTWKNNNVPDLYLGADSPDAWEVNPQRGNKALVSLLTPVTSNQELDKAIAANKQFYITAQPDDAYAYLMSLYPEGNVSPDGKTANPITGQALELGNSLREELWQSYYGGVFQNLPTAPIIGDSDQTMTVLGDDGTYRYVTLNDLRDQDFWEDYVVLNVGRTSEKLPLDTLKKKYNVLAQNVQRDGNNVYYYFRNDTGAVVTPVNPDTNNASIPTYYSYNGFYYYTVDYSSRTSTGSLSGTVYERERTYTFEFFFQPPDGGDPVSLGTSQTVVQGTGGFLGAYEVRDFLYSDVGYDEYIQPSLDNDGNQIIDANGELMFDYTYFDQAQNQNVTIQVPMVNVSASRFHGEDNDNEDETSSAIVSGNFVSKVSTDNGTAYHYYDVVNDKYYQSNGTEITNYDTQNPPSTVLLNRYPAYSFSHSDLSNPSYLSFLRQYKGRNLLGTYGDTYSMWAGTGTQYTNLDLENGRSTEGVLVFEEGKNYCYIQYTLNSRIQYVDYNYDASNGTATFTNSGTKTKLYVYIIEGVIDMDFGVNTFIPTDIDDENSTSHKLPANSVVFWPQMTLTQGGYNTNGGYKDTPVYTASTDINATKYATPDPTYSIIPLTGTNGLNWGTKDGYKLGDYGLDKKFQMADEAAFGTLINIGDWSLPLGNSNTLVAPVGSNGVKATIPKGCVAFRVNAGGTQTIRIIVAVPTTDYYRGESGFDLDTAMDYYIGVWKVAAAGDEILSQFNKSDALEKFELPRSYSFDFNDDPTKVEETNSHVDVEYGGQKYRTYLNGDCFLVAYEFAIDGGDDGGVFVIGSVHGDESSSSGKEVPMEIVHFSVSGTASAGRDGVTGNQLGAIDFVYDDTEGNIATIDKTGSTTGPTNGTEYYSNYYASQCLLYSNNEQKDANGYLLLNEEKLWIRRYVDNSTPNSAKTVIAYGVEGEVPDSFLVKQYAINSDEVETETTQSTQ